MRTTFVYAATQAPRYRSMLDRDELIDNLVGQRAFLEAALTSICYRLQGSVELRFRSDQDGQIHTFISLETDTSTAVLIPESELRVIERLLPLGYSWCRTDLKALDDNLAGRPVRIAKLLRTVDFVDLPPLTPDAVRNLVNESSNQTPVQAVLNVQGRQNKPAKRNDESSKYSSNPRELPPLHIIGQNLANLRLCIPILGSIGTWRAEARVLFQEMLVSRPVIVSIHMRPTASEELDRIIPVAAMWRLFLKHFASEIAGSGISNPQEMVASFAKFTLPANRLIQTTIRCAALDDQSAISVASILAACWGGASSFTVIPPRRGVSVSALKDIWFDYRREPIEGRLGDAAEKEWIDLALQTARSNGVEQPEDPEAIEFLLRCPHIFTMDEVQLISQLPVADENGLPGMRTEMVPPFAAGPPRFTTDRTKAGLTLLPQSSDARCGQLAASGFPPQIRIGLEIDRHGLARDDGQVWHHLPLRDLAKHAFIVGSTGSGKTQTTLFLMRELDRLNVNFMVIEPVKTEYYRALKPIMGDKLRRYCFEGNHDGDLSSDFMAFDPMRLQPGVTVARHASYLKACFESAFPLDPVLALMLEAGIRSYYTTANKWGCGLKMFTRGSAQTHRVLKREELVDNKQRDIHLVFPSFKGFQKFFLEYYLPEKVVKTQGDGAKSPQLAQLLEQWRQIFERRFDAVASGMIGLAAKKADEIYGRDRSRYDCFGEILNGPAIIELDGIPDNDQKALMMAFLLTFLFERRQSEALVSQEGRSSLNLKPTQGGNVQAEVCDQLRHVVVIEEAHRVLANPLRGGRADLAGSDARGNAVSLFVDMLAEIRAFGQGLIIVEQIPTKIISEAVKNTNLKIMLRLTSADDRNFLGEAMNFTEEQKKFVTGLRAEAGRGIDMVVFEQQLDQPMLLQLPLDLLPIPGALMPPVHERLFQEYVEKVVS